MHENPRGAMAPLLPASDDHDSTLPQLKIFSICVAKARSTAGITKSKASIAKAKFWWYHGLFV